MKMLLHLMAKDLRHVRGQLIFFAICVLAALSVPLVQRWTGGPHWSVQLMHFSSLLMIVSVMMGLLVGWIHLDHPRDTTGFLQTRPLSPVMRWLPKFLCWALILLLPVLVAVLLQLLFYRLDLSSAECAKFISRAFLRISGAYGVMALMAVLVRNHRLTALLCLVPLIFTFLLQEAYTPASFGMVELPADSALSASRFLVGQSILGIGGFLVAGLLLAHCTWRSWAPAVAGLVGLSLLAEACWPWDIIGHERDAVVNDPARVAELEKKVQVGVKGKMRYSGHRKGEPYNYITDRLKIEMPAGSIELPHLVRQTYDPLRLADERVVESRQSALAGEAVSSKLFHPPTPVETLQNLLGHETARQGAPFDLSHYRAQIQILTQEPLPNHARARLAGRLDFSWYRPVLLADLPLEPGVSFSRQGRSVKVLEVSSFDGLRLKLLLTSFYPNPSFFSTNQQEPEFQIFAAHPQRKEITSYGGIHRSPGITSSLVVNELSLTVDYRVIGADGQVVKAGPFWAQKARLYIVKSESIGSGSHPYEGEVTIQHPPSKR
ncbi:MAG: hypothetical protein V4662_13920 [Verrucomicrobiota bacterium]